ncbi:MAG TPA: helix-turn-helix domain-containing protein [Thermomicrobiales bacterium]|nr:helix-turn-helix domain-containing protein [Thermomicrobiales bacterium]
MTDDAKLAYSIKEAAKALGIHTDLAYRMAQCGELPAVKLGARWLVPVAALERWLAERIAAAQSPDTVFARAERSPDRTRPTA